MFTDTSLEASLKTAISLDEPNALLDRFSRWVRESGMPDELAAGDYIAERLKALGVPVTVYEPALYLSVPLRSELRVLDGDRSELVTSRPPAFSKPTAGVELVGELCYVPSKYAGGMASLFDTADAARSGRAGTDPVRGRIVVTEGFSMPGNVSSFERRGAIGQIYIHPGRDIHEGICTSIWGAPTADSIGRKPGVPVVCVNHADGERLAARAAQGATRVGIQTWLKESWEPCRLPVVDIRGTDDPDEFLLVHGHYDSWYVGIGDNAVGDATLLELARLLWTHRAQLKRSVRIAWWPGHSTGRYAGSTWFADEFADEIDEWCIAQLNIDSPGCAGATAYQEVMWMAEAGDLCRQAIADAVAEPATGLRPLRAGDYSFNQIGPTGFYMLLSNIPVDERQRRGYYAVGGCGGNIAWHTPNDVMDVADGGIMRRDLQVYVTTIARVLNAPLYPLDYTKAVDEIRAAVEPLRDAARGHVDLSPIVSDLERLRAGIERWQRSAAAKLAESGNRPEVRRALNATLRRIARVLVPLNYARGERFDHDPAVKLPAVPRLEAAAQLATAPADALPFLVTGLRRERNKVRAMLRELSRELR